MRLIVLDENFDTLGSIPLFRTLIWVPRYEKLGCFELYTSKDYFWLLNAGKYLYRNDDEKLGVIDEVNYSQDENGAREAYAKGNFAEKLLANRVISEMVTISGNTETAMRNLVNQFAINPADGDRKVEHLRLGEVSGISGTVSAQATGDNLSDKLYEIGNTQEISHRVRYDFVTNDLVFEVWQGVDRRDSQEENSWAIFSNSFYNIRNVVYNRNSSSYKNFAYVAGAGEGADRVIVTVDLRQEGEERLEIWVDARDLQQQDEDGNDIPLATYKEQLVQRGKESWPSTGRWRRSTATWTQTLTWYIKKTLTWETTALTSIRRLVWRRTSVSLKSWRHTRAGPRSFLSLLGQTRSPRSSSLSKGRCKSVATLWFFRQ